MTVSEVMTANVHSVAPEISADNARAIMRRHRVHHLVVKKASNWVGIVSAHDLARRSLARRTRPVKVGEVMTRHVMTIDEQASVDRASHRMRGHSIGCLLVLRGGQVVGIITTSDLLHQIDRGADRRRRANTNTAVHHRVAHRSRPRADGVW